MNLKIIGDRTFHVDVTFEFYDTRKLWSTFLEVEDKINVKNTDGEILAYCNFHVVGRRPEEVAKIILEYDGHTVVLLPGEDKFANLSPIILYGGGRDFWTNQLRQKVLASDNR